MPTDFYITHAIAILVLAAVNLLVLYLWWRCRRWVAVVLLCTAPLAGVWAWFPPGFRELLMSQGPPPGSGSLPGIASLLQQIFAFLCGAAIPSGICGVFLLPDPPKKRDHDRCEQCGYLLCGLPENRCPECGTPFTSPELSTQLAEDEADDETGPAPSESPVVPAMFCGAGLVGFFAGPLVLHAVLRFGEGALLGLSLIPLALGATLGWNATSRRQAFAYCAVFGVAAAIPLLAETHTTRISGDSVGGLAHALGMAYSVMTGLGLFGIALLSAFITYEYKRRTTPIVSEDNEDVGA